MRTVKKNANPRGESEKAHNVYDVQENGEGKCLVSVSQGTIVGPQMLSDQHLCLPTFDLFSTREPDDP